MHVHISQIVVPTRIGQYSIACNGKAACPLVNVCWPTVDLHKAGTVLQSPAIITFWGFSTRPFTAWRCQTDQLSSYTQQQWATGAVATNQRCYHSH